MSLIKKIWDKIKNPHGFWLAVFYVLFVAVVTLTLVLVIIQPNQTVVHYMLYVVSAITLTYFVYTIVIFAPSMKRHGTLSFP